MAEEKKEDALSAPATFSPYGSSATTTPAVIASAGAATATHGFYFGVPSHLALECPNHVAEAAEHPETLPDIVHPYIENGGGQQVPLIIYGENTKDWEIIVDGSSNTNKWSHSW